MVVAVGLTLADPLAAVEVKLPGVMAIVVAPVAAQLRVLLPPELMVVGLAANEPIVGAVPPPDFVPFATFPQPEMMRRTAPSSPSSDRQSQTRQRCNCL